MENLQSPIVDNKPCALLRGSDACQYLGMGRVNFQKFVKLGVLPQPVRITPKRPVWRVTDLDAYLAGL